VGNNIGDVVGCYLDLDNQTISYTLNGKDLGIAFSDFVVTGWPIYPAITLESTQVCSPNFGTRPFT
jgi:hypothetical protein